MAIDTTQNPTTSFAPQGTANPLYNPSATPGQAGSLDPTLNSANLGTSSTIKYTPPPPLYPVSGVDTSTYSTANTLGPNEQGASDLSKQIEDLNNQLSGEPTYQNQQNQAAGVNDIQKAINDNTTAIKQLQNEANAIPQVLQEQALGRGQTAAGLQPIQTGMLRENSIKALTLSSISDSLNNNLVAAQTKANQAVQAIYGPMEADLKAKSANLQLILNDPATTLEEKNRANAQQAIITAQANQVAQQKDNQAAILKTAQDAATNASNFKPIAVDGFYYPTLSSALQGIANAKTPAEAVAVQTATGLLPSNNKSQIIGDASAGFSNVTTDANGKVISVTPVLAGKNSGLGTMTSITTANGNINVPTILSPYIQTSYDGTTYADLSSLSPTDKAAYAQQASAAGIKPILDTATASKLNAISVSKENLANIADSLTSQNLINDKSLPVLQGLGNSVSSFLGNANVKSFQAWRTAIINNVQALAGGTGSGLRINKAEIDAALQNDLPVITGTGADNLSTAQAKIEKLRSQLDAWNKQLLGGGNTAASHVPPVGTIVESGGKKYHVIDAQGNLEPL